MTFAYSRICSHARVSHQCVAALSPEDPSLWCISAWNDFGFKARRYRRQTNQKGTEIQTCRRVKPCEPCCVPMSQESNVNESNRNQGTAVDPCRLQRTTYFPGSPKVLTEYVKHRYHLLPLLIGMIGLGLKRTVVSCSFYSVRELIIHNGIIHSTEYDICIQATFVRLHNEAETTWFTCWSLWLGSRSWFLADSKSMAPDSEGAMNLSQFQQLSIAASNARWQDWPTAPTMGLMPIQDVKTEDIALDEQSKDMNGLTLLTYFFNFLRISAEA